MPSSKTIYLGIKGSVIALDTATGQQLWATHLKGSDFVNVVLDGDKLYAATYGEIFCLDPATGEGKWHNNLTGFGRGLITMAAETITPSSLVSLMAEKRRRDAEAAAAQSANMTTMG
ncbi:MAG: PQQ-binding-like beta-propeller repeat protein [Verrucomicrobia bacterium]|nr:PQQ-binding-like beta-propeller repeat protein [Verrucomicrobiota bacterium]